MPARGKGVGCVSGADGGGVEGARGDVDEADSDEASVARVALGAGRPATRKKRAAAALPRERSGESVPAQRLTSCTYT
eukprot:5406018-Pleurochrysis_carterae.AAC.1